MKCRWAFMVIAVVLGLHPVWGQVPGILTYQGRVTSGGVPFTGQGQFKFALVSPPDPTVTSYWSHDGSSVNGGEPASAIAIGVTDGVFTVLLGDAGIPNMQSIPAEVFAHPDVRLRLWFNDGVNGWSGLSPDQRITAAGYALRAAGTSDGSVTTAMLGSGIVTAAQLADGAVTTPKLAPGAVTAGRIAENAVTAGKVSAGAIQTPQVADGAITAAKLSPGAVGTGQLADAAVTAGKLAPGAVVAGSIAANSIGSAQIADSLRLQDLDIETGDGLDRIALGITSNSGRLQMNHGAIGRFLEAIGTEDGGFFRLYDKLGGALTGQTTVELGSSSSGGFIRVLQDNASTGVQVHGQNGDQPGGAVLVYRENGLGATLLGDSSGGGGVLGLRNGSGTATVELVAAETAGNPGGQLVLRRQNAASGIVLDGQYGTGGGLLQVYNAAGFATVSAQGTEGADAGDGAGQVTLRQADGDTGVLVDAQAGSLGGQLTVHDTAGQLRVNIVGQQESGGGYIGVRDASGTVTAQISGAEVGTDGAQIALARANGTKTVFLDAQLGNGGGSLRLAKPDGTIPIKLDASAGGGGRVTTQVLEITGGSDLSEQFEIDSERQPPEPGMLVCIDPVHPGRLVPSSRAYDRTVAGIISGAGGVQSGLLMGQRGSIADGRHSVALTGRVYCQAEADSEPIRPGDLLTTSSIAGHAMKVADPARASGAVIGKAMSPLESGRGLVLVLVSLQ